MIYFDDDNEETMLTPCDKYVAEQHYTDCLTEDDYYPSLEKDNRNILYSAPFEPFSGLSIEESKGWTKSDITPLF